MFTHAFPPFLSFLMYHYVARHLHRDLSVLLSLSFRSIAKNEGHVQAFRALISEFRHDTFAKMMYAAPKSGIKKASYGFSKAIIKEMLKVRVCSVCVNQVFVCVTEREMFGLH